MLLTPEQLEAGFQILQWYRSTDQHWTLGGYAGTGKTTVVAHVINNLEIVKSEIVLCAYTAKAVSVIRAKTPDYEARTIHSLIYRPLSTPAMDALRQQLSECRNKPQTAAVTQDIIDISAKLKELRRKAPREWRCKTPAEFANNGPIRLIVVDECSMIGETMFNDIMSYGVKVLFLGDPGQLDPIRTGKKELKLHDLAPEKYLLTQILRNDGGIKSMAEMARKQIPIPFQKISAESNFGKALKDRVPDKMLIQADQVICHKHVTRRALNARIRAVKGIASKYPLAGEKVVCKLNNHDANLANGVTYTLRSDSIAKGTHVILDLEEIDEVIEADKRMFEAYSDSGIAEDIDKGNCKWKADRPPFDFGYALTVHSAQGSEWPRVIVWDDFNARDYKPDQYAKWLYTAITRAAKGCLVAA